MTVRVSEKLALIDRIGRELQSRYRYDEIDSYLSAFGVQPPSEGVGTNSKWVYSKVALRNAPASVLASIAEDLGLGTFGSAAARLAPPTCWPTDSSELRLFVSHVSSAKDKAMRLKECLTPLHIAAFVAHEDIEPDRPWQGEIERALWTMDALVAICTTGFAASAWTQQEVGFALGRGVKVVALKMGEDPKGFLSGVQALLRGKKSADQVASEVRGLLLADERTKQRMEHAGLTPDDASLEKLRDEIPF